MLKSIYEKMWTDAAGKIKRNNLEIDPLIDDPDDSRRGITLQARPEKKILDNFNIFLSEARNCEPGQYYYLPGEIHVTVLSIITCQTGFNLSELNMTDYIKCIEESVKNIKPFIIEFKGITASPSCILMKGFPENDSLELIRENLRTEFRNGTLYNSIDSRYRIQTAHSTVIRFREKLKYNRIFLSLLEKYRECDFGKTNIKHLELVQTDWYHRKERVNLLHRFEL